MEEILQMTDFMASQTRQICCLLAPTFACFSQDHAFLELVISFQVQYVLYVLIYI